MHQKWLKERMIFPAAFEYFDYVGYPLSCISLIILISSFDFCQPQVVYSTIKLHKTWETTFDIFDWY